MITELSVAELQVVGKHGSIADSPIDCDSSVRIAPARPAFFRHCSCSSKPAERPPDWNGVIDFGDEGSVVNLSSFNEGHPSTQNGLKS